MSDKPPTDDPAASEPDAPRGSARAPATVNEPPQGEPEFRLTRAWVIVGVVAVLLGLGAGLVMSSSWLH